MKVLMVHKFYYVEGGAERYFFNLAKVLEQNGHQVIPFAMSHPKNYPSAYDSYFADNLEVDRLQNGESSITTVKGLVRFVYNQRAAQQLARLLEKVKPDIAHVHSVHHHLSPSVLFVLKKYRLPVVQTLHDYKLVCPNYIFLNGRGHVCEACAGRFFYHALLNKCFKNSYPASLLLAVESYVQFALQAHKKNVDLFISPSRFLAEKLVQYGYPAERMVVQPYTLPVAEYRPQFSDSDYFVFTGRLTREKGLAFLLQAMKEIKDARLCIVGTGPLETEIRKQIKSEGMDNVELLGYKSGDELKSIVANGKFVVVPSQWYDNSPLVIYEAFSLGKPVIGARIGGISELISEGRTGFLFDPKDVPHFVRKVNELIHDPSKAMMMGRAARQKAESEFAPDAHYAKILELYQRAGDLHSLVS